MLQILVESIVRLPRDDALPRLRALATECANADATDGNEMRMAVARGFFRFDEKGDGMALLEPLFARTVLDPFDTATVVGERSWTRQVEAARVLYETDDSELRVRAGRALDGILNDIRSLKTPVHAWGPLVELARVRSVAGERPESIAEALNEALIAAYRPRQDYRGIGREPSSRCQALCAIAEAAFELKLRELGRRCLTQATSKADANPRIRQRVMDYCRIGEGYAKGGDHRSAVSILRRASEAIPHVVDEDEHLRRGLAQEEALSHVIRCCSDLGTAREVGELLDVLLGHAKHVSDRDNRLDSLGNIIEAAIKLPEARRAKRIVDGCIDALIRDLDAMTGERRAEERSKLLASLIAGYGSARAEVRQFIRSKLAVDLSFSESDVFTAAAASPLIREAAIAQMIRGYAELGESGSVDERLHRIWKLATEKIDRRVLGAYITATRELQCSGWWHRTVDYLFDHPVYPRDAEQIELRRLAANVYIVTGNHARAEPLLVAAESSATAIEALPRRAEQLANVARDWLALGHRSRAVDSLTAAIETMRETVDTDVADAFAAVARGCATLGDSSLLGLAFNTAVSNADLSRIERAVPPFASACESLEDRPTAIHYLDHIADLTETTAASLPGFDWWRVRLLCCVYASAAVVHYKAGHRQSARNAIDKLTSLALDLLQAEAPSNREFFVQSALSDCCRVCGVLAEWPESRAFLDRIEASLRLFGGREVESWISEIHSRMLEFSIAEALLVFGDKDRAADMLRKGVGYWTAKPLGGKIMSEGIRMYIGPLMAAEGRLTKDLLDRVTDPWYLKEACDGVCRHMDFLSAGEMLPAFQLVVEAASRLNTVDYATVVLRLLTPLARQRSTGEVEQIAAGILEGMRIAIRDPSSQHV